MFVPYWLLIPVTGLACFGLFGFVAVTWLWCVAAVSDLDERDRIADFNRMVDEHEAGGF